MPRQMLGGRLIVASHNRGKVDEITAMLAPWEVEISDAAAWGLAEPEEDAATYRGNAALKALAAARATGVPALADDSGFEVAAIDNAPGLYSARWAKTASGRDFGLAMKRVHEAVMASGSDGRHCRFVSALCLAWPDGHCEVTEGQIDGEMVWPPRGAGGFGYDPIFRPLGYGVTFGEMDPAQKDAISHRARAFAALISRCFAATPKRQKAL